MIVSRGFGLLLALFAIAARGGAQERTLFWRSLDVAAHLDADGRLHTREDQRIVFTGPWNGGERRFRVGLGQVLKLDRIARIDAGTGTERPLVRGDLSRVDEYGWSDGTTLRWRSRLPSDPPFDHTEILYRVEYTLSNVLVARGDEYRLAHDFAFPERSGDIEKFSLELTLDPAWRPVSTLPSRLERANLRPGESVVVRAALHRAGESAPAGVLRVPPAPARFALLALFGVGLVVLHVSFFRREAKTGRFAPLPASDSIDDEWIRKNLLTLPPETVGAAWDEKTGAPEVAAVLARLAAEGKIRAEVEKKGLFRSPNFRMTLLADRASFQGYEKSLVASLFFAGATTDTEALKEHYRKTGFDPASKIRGPVEHEVSRRFRAPARRTRWRLAAASFGVAVVVLVLAGVARTEQFLGLAFGLGAAIAALVVAVPAAFAFRDRIAGWVSRAIVFLAPLWMFAAAVAAVIVQTSWPASLPLLAGLALLSLSLFQAAFGFGAIRDDPEKIRFRKGLAAAREHFARELARPTPRLDDAWLPYLLAFGLGGNVDRWFRAFGKTSSARIAPAAGGGSFGGGGSSASGGGWTGGGGFSGGAGSSGSWAAVEGVASGVSAVSSGSGGGGGGGGGSSGGGGGGGW